MIKMSYTKTANKTKNVNLHVHCVPKKKQSQRIFSIILFRSDKILQKLENLFPSLLRTQLQLHSQ